MNSLHLSPEAQSDLAEIKAYITEELDNPKAAIAIVASITKDIRILQTHALIGTPLHSVANMDSDYRFLVSGKYMVFYRVTGKDIFVDRILYGRRNYLRILFGDTDEA